MTWITINETVTVEPDGDGEPVEVPKGLPRRAPYMDDVLEANDYDPDEYLPIDYNENRKAQVPKSLAEAMADRYDHAELSGENE